VRRHVKFSELEFRGAYTNLQNVTRSHSTLDMLHKATVHCRPCRTNGFRNFVFVFISVWPMRVVSTPVDHLGPKKLSLTVAELFMADPPVGKTRLKCSWAGRQPRVYKFQQPSLPCYQRKLFVCLFVCKTTNPLEKFGMHTLASNAQE